MSAPVGFAFALHLHQPVGNFDDVFRDHVDGVYRPFLARSAERALRPISLHVSGPLLDWLERRDPAFLDAVGREVSDGAIELLGSGRTEPVLAALGRDDRVAQLQRMGDLLEQRFGVRPTGAWLTERVWEQDLAADLARGGVGYALLDDRHFLAAGFERAALDRPYRTEADGLPLDLLSIDERLRYLIPFRPVETIERFFVERRAEGARVVVLGDDGEKFGGWPGTRRWVYERGWLTDFLDAMERLREGGAVELVTTGAAAARESGGLAYPSPGSYREMEEWTLPRPAALELERLRGSVIVPTGSPVEGAEHPSLRGGHWRSFQTRYPVTNRMHKTALALSRLCRERGDPPAAREAIERAQCNDAYWHGVFGGVYLPHLRRAIWRELASAEAALRENEPAAASLSDIDFDGREEVLLHTTGASLIASPSRGATVESLLRLETGENDVDMVGRHFEAYHGDPATAPAWAEVRDAWEAATAGDDAADVSDDEGAASIHELDLPERPAPPAIDELPPAIFRERLLETMPDDTAAPGYPEPAARPRPVEYELEGISVEDGRAVASFLATAPEGLRKTIRLEADGAVRLELRWEPFPDGTFETELWLAHPRSLRIAPEGVREIEDVVTLARSERGYEEIVQGRIVRLRWPGRAGTAAVEIRVRETGTGD
ncbi:MAG: alpha-amylase/4-alpha-glucanotransferase domain-containing protein [Gemmatimonadota bacterium]|nr:alpha-amylase/4-alpha-glucanotransferase domain-containing protein [Gemmatimonadota bacterium]